MNYLWADSRGPNTESPMGLHVTTRTSPPFGIAWPLAQTGSAPTHMPWLSWRPGAQDTLQVHLASSLARPWIAWIVSSVGADHGHHRDNATQKCNSASIASGDHTCCRMCSGLCSSSLSSCPMCGRRPRALCGDAPGAAAAPGSSPSPGCTPLAWKATSSPLSLTHGALVSPGNVDLATAQK